VDGAVGNTVVAGRLILMAVESMTAMTFSTPISMTIQNVRSKSRTVMGSTSGMAGGITAREISRLTPIMTSATARHYRNTKKIKKIVLAREQQGSQFNEAYTH